MDTRDPSPKRPLTRREAPAPYQPEAAKDGWARCLAWFQKYLKV